MKKLLLSLSLLLIFATVTYSQIRIGPYAGISGSHLTTGELEISRYELFGKRSPVIGIAAEKVLKDQWALKGALQWVKTGGVVKEQQGLSYSYRHHETEIQYYQAILAVKYLWREKIYFEIGGYGGWMNRNTVDVTFRLHQNPVRLKREVGDAFTPLDVGVICGIGTRYKKIDLNLNFRHGFNRILREINNISKERNIALQLTLGYYFEL